VTSFISICSQPGPQNWGATRQWLPTPKFSKAYVFVRSTNKLHHFASLPKISSGCCPAPNYDLPELLWNHL